MKIIKYHITETTGTIYTKTDLSFPGDFQKAHLGWKKKLLSLCFHFVTNLNMEYTFVLWCISRRISFCQDRES